MSAEPSKVSLLTTLAMASVLPSIAIPARVPLAGSRILLVVELNGLLILIVVGLPLRISLRTVLVILVA